VVEGIRRAAAIRALLTWALVKVTNAGDRIVMHHVVVLHVTAADGVALIGRIDFYFPPSPSISSKKQFFPFSFDCSKGCNRSRSNIL
jgi:hypothetical protein